MEGEKTILVVEDESSLRAALVDKLTRAQFSVLEAKNGQEGLALALAKKPSVILLDILMPVMDGLSMLKELRKDPWGKDVHVIILTNLSENEKVSEAMQYGSFEYYVKTDWKLDDLVKKLQEKLPGRSS